MLHKTVGYLGRARQPAESYGLILNALQALETRLKRYQVCDHRDDDPKRHCARYNTRDFRSRMNIFIDKLTALRRSKAGQPLVIP